MAVFDPQTYTRACNLLHLNGKVRLEYVAGNSDKFYELEAGYTGEYIARWGRRGSTGQSMSVGNARSASEKLQEKVAKGYGLAPGQYLPTERPANVSTAAARHGSSAAHTHGFIANPKEAAQFLDDVSRGVRAMAGAVGDTARAAGDAGRAMGRLAQAAGAIGGGASSTPRDDGGPWARVAAAPFRPVTVDDFLEKVAEYQLDELDRRAHDDGTVEKLWRDNRRHLWCLRVKPDGYALAYLGAA